MRAVGWRSDIENNNTTGVRSKCRYWIVCVCTCGHCSCSVFVQCVVR